MLKPAAAILLMLPTLSFAWGGEGHQIVALIAEKQLMPKTQGRHPRVARR